MGGERPCSYPEDTFSIPGVPMTGRDEESLIIFTDGASRGNPGPSCYAYIYVERGKIVRERAGLLGRATNNQAEYRAVIEALREARTMGKRDVTLHSDSELVVRQINGGYRVRNPPLMELKGEVEKLAAGFQRLRIIHLPRSNPFLRYADTLCNRCLDELADRDCTGETGYVLRPIGIVHAPYMTRSEAPRQGRFSEKESELEIYSEFTKGLRDLEKEQYLIVFTWFHAAARDVLEARPPHSSEDHGVFATRSPDRPNPIGFNVVTLLGVEGNRLRVKWLDAIDKTPLLDIKPFSAGVDCPGGARN